MVDIHSHVLYGLDDGAETREESLAMLEMAALSGTTDIVATPHANHEYVYEPELVDERIAELSGAAGDMIHIHRGCDFHLSFDNIQEALQNPFKFSINGERYLLVEFSDLLIPKTTTEVFVRMIGSGVVPIITHPERNPILQRRLDDLETWVSYGCLIQVTALSFLGRFGRTAHAVSEELMSSNLVHFVASDAHDTKHRTPVLLEAYDYVLQKWGRARAEALFVLNPQATLTGDALPPAPEEPPKPEEKKWYRFWRSGAGGS